MTPHSGNHRDGNAPKGSDKSTDPVCGMQVEMSSDALAREYGGEIFFFCSEECRETFDKDPWLYASGRSETTRQAVQPGTQWSCPMHPEIVRDEPGSCPICGMALEPMVPSDETSGELVDFTRRMWISAAAAVPLIILTMGELLGLPVRDWLGHRIATYLEFLLAAPIVLWAGQPFFRRGLDSVRSLSPKMWTLISLGVGAAYVYSLFATFAPGVFPAQYRKGDGVGTYFEAAVVIITLVFVGQVLELRARERTGDAIRALMDLAPKTARRILPDGTEYDAPLENVVEGDLLRVRPGDRVPVDGEVGGPHRTADRPHGAGGRRWVAHGVHISGVDLEAEQERPERPRRALAHHPDLRGQPSHHRNRTGDQVYRLPADRPAPRHGLWHCPALGQPGHSQGVGAPADGRDPTRGQSL